VLPRQGVFPELIASTQGGELFAPNTPAALADALARLMDDAELSEYLGRRGRCAVLERHGDESMAAQTWGVFESAIQAAGVSAGY